MLITYVLPMCTSTSPQLFGRLNLVKRLSCRLLGGDAEWIWEVLPVGCARLAHKMLHEVDRVLPNCVQSALECFLLHHCQLGWCELANKPRGGVPKKQLLCEEAHTNFLQNRFKLAGSWWPVHGYDLRWQCFIDNIGIMTGHIDTLHCLQRFFSPKRIKKTDFRSELQVACLPASSFWRLSVINVCPSQALNFYSFM